MKLLIIADDLTGALDTAVQVSGRCVKTLVAPWAGAKVDCCEALCINLDMRHDTPGEAFYKTADLLARFPDVPYIYLKTDSVLRGNLSAAFAALLEACGGPVMFVPAYPKAGRTTVRGEQYAGGIKLGDSPFAQDPLNPMVTGVVREILNTSHEVSCISISQGEDIPAPQSIRGRLLVFDCETQEELIRIGETLQNRSALRLSAGCAGFAEILCGHIPFERERARFIPDTSPVLFLSGSANKATFDQLAHSRENGIEIVKIPAELKLSDKPVPVDDLNPIFARLDKSFASKRSVVLASAEEFGDLVEIPRERHANIQHIFAQTARRFVDKGLRNLALFGGDTAIAVLRELNLSCVRPLKEIQVGVPLCTAGNLNIATKSGGLGNIDAITAIDTYLRAKKNTSAK